MTIDRAASTATPGRWIRRAGILAWSLIGMLGVLVVALWAASQIAVVLVPLLVALFPAAALGPVQEWLVHRGWPRPLAALALVIGLLALIAGAVAGPIPALVGQIPALMESLSTAAQRLQGLLDRLPGADRFAGLDSLTGQATGWLFGADPLAGTLRLASTALTVLSGIALALLTVYFVLYDSTHRAEPQCLDDVVRFEG